jgi:hypothetical protein
MSIDIANQLKNSTIINFNTVCDNGYTSYIFILKNKDGGLCTFTIDNGLFDIYPVTVNDKITCNGCLMNKMDQLSHMEVGGCLEG